MKISEIYGRITVEYVQDETLQMDGKIQRKAHRCWWYVLWLAIDCNVLRLRTLSFSICGTSEESALMKLCPIQTWVIEGSGAKMS